MNDTVCQNGVSRSQSSSHEHHGSMPNIPTKRDGPHCRCSSGSANKPSTPYEAVSDHNAEKENDKFHCRAVLLKLLQPPGSSVLHAQHNSCPLACQQTEKTLLKPDLRVSHCLRHAGNQQVSRNSVDIDREVNEELTQTNRQCNENISRKDSGRSSLLPTTVQCQGCEARARRSYSEELQSRTDRCQYFTEERQQYFNGHACFRKDTCDTKRAPYIALQINREVQRKDEDGPQQMCPPTWPYKGCDSSICQLSPSNQTLDKSHPEMGVTGASKSTILQNTERLPDHLCAPAESGKNSPYQIDKRTRQDPSSSTQEKLEDHKLNSLSSYSMCSPESNRREPFCLSGEWSSPVLRIANGKGHRREERNVILETTSESDKQTVPPSPNESSPVIENQGEECTPVIVQCYSLSAASPTFNPTSMSDAQFMNREKHDASVNIRNDEVPPVLVSHSPRSSYQQHSPRSLKSANRLQNNEDFVYDSSAPSPSNIANLHSHNFSTQPNHTTDESATSELGVDDEENQTRSAVLPGPFHKSSAIPAGIPCLNCQAGQRATRRHHYLYNNPWTEPHVHSSQSVSHQKTRCPPDLYFGHESEGKFPNWHTIHVPNEGRTALKVHDYYEERRILVGKVYQDIPDSVDSPHRNRTSTSPYARMPVRQPYQNDRCQSPRESAEVYHVQAGEEGSTQICARQREIAVGSRKRKSRQPRPQRVNANDPALARIQCQHPGQHAEGRQEVSFYNKFHHHASSPFQPDASLSKEVHRKGRKDVEVCGNESEIYSFQPVHETTDQHESVPRRNNHVFEEDSSRPKFYRSGIRPETYTPWRPLFHDKRAIKVPTVDRSEHFFVYPRGPVPSYAPVDRHRRANHGPHPYQMNSFYQARTPYHYFAYSNEDVMEHPFNLSPDGNVATERHQRVSIGRRTPENCFATESRYDRTQRCYSPRMRTSYSGPSERSMPTDESVTSQFERNTESSWNVRGVPVHGEDRGNNHFYHAVPSNSKSPQHNSEEKSLLPCDHGCVSSTTVDDGADLQGKDDSDRPFQAVQASAATDGIERASEEQEKRDLFLQTGEVWANHLPPTVKERKFVCRYCSKKFAHFSTLQNHLRTHTGDKPFQCKFCSRRFAQSGVLKAHLRTHTGDKPFACMYCGKVFAQSTTLTNHLRTHTGQKPYVCQFCGKSFSQPSTLRKHELSHTKERPYPCKFCGKAFAQQSTLTNHLRSHTGQRPYKCHFCDKSFAQLSTLDRHLRLHSSVSLKPYQCPHCSKSFSYFSNLSSHMQSHEQEQGDA